MCHASLDEIRYSTQRREFNQLDLEGSLIS
jgi:hypothetical protein